MHTCPDCGQACHCNGDIDDHENELEAENCEHLCEPESDEDDNEDLYLDEEFF
jgi:hypothetical protein